MDNMIGQRIKKRRKELGITQTQIQELTSVTSGNLSCIENGKYLPSSTALLELSRVLDCSIDWILTGESVISKKSSFLDITDSMDEKLLNLFHTMSSDDKEELLLIAEMKANKGKRQHYAKSSPLENNNVTSEIA